MRDGLRRLLQPESVAIVGLSADPAKHGARVLDNLRRFGFTGPIWGVNPSGGRLHGIDTVADTRDIPGSPDVMVLAVPNAHVEDAIRDAATLRAGGAIILGGGYAEAGPDGVERQRRVVDSARAAGVRLLGPNSAGIIDRASSTVLSFLTCLDRPAESLRAGPVALIAQSGGSASYLHVIAAERGGGLATSISTGNEADLGVGEVLEAVIERDDIRAVALLLETIRDGGRFIASAERALARGIPLAVCKVGRSARGAGIMATHTGALATPSRRYDAVFADLGITVAETPEELYDIAELLARSPTPSGPGAGIITHSGGTAVLLADLCEDASVPLPEPSAALVDALQDQLQHGSAKNPTDLGGIITAPERFGEVVRLFLDDPTFPSVMAVSTPHPAAHSPGRIAQLAELHAEHDTPLIHLWLGGDLGAEGLEDLRVRGLPVTTEVRAAIRALAGLGRLAERRASRRLDRPAPEAEVLALIDSLPTSSEGVLNEPDAMRLLGALGFTPARNALATDADGAVAAAAAIGWPVVVKLVSSEVLHKSDSGGVHLDLRDEAGVRTACARITEAVAQTPGLRIDGYLVEEFVPGPEVVLGIADDDALGPLVLLGTGGVLAEAIDDVVLGLPPIDRGTAQRMIDGLRGVALLRGFRGSAAVDEEGLVDEIVRLGDVALAYREQLAEVDLNPVVWSNGAWRLADAVVRLRGRRERLSPMRPDEPAAPPGH